MPTKYHINSAGKLAVCTATQRACRYGNHFDTVDAAKNHFLSSLNAEYDNPLRKVERIQTEAPAPAGRAPIVYPYLNILHPKVSDFGVDYVYDSYGPPWGEEEEDYNRNAIYTGLRIKSVNIREVLTITFGFRNADDVPDELMTLAEDNGWDDPDFWNIHGDMGYYGEEVQIEPPYNMQQELTTWYYSLPNVNDPVLNYVRADGTETIKATPVEAVKRMIAETHPEMTRKIQSARYSSVGQVPLNAIKTTATRLNKAGAYKGSTLVKDIHGVLLKTDDGYLLIDGAKRLKHFRANFPTRKPKFIILSEKAFTRDNFSGRGI